MLTSFGGHYTSYSDDVVVGEKLKTLYFDSSTRSHHRITVSYRFNETVPTAIENQLLRSEAYAQWVDKEKILIPMYSEKLDTSTYELWPTVTGLEFRTLEDGNIEWRTFEDTREVVERIPIADVSHHITNIKSSGLINLKRLTGPAFTSMYKDKKCILKAHEAAYQNKVFRSEFDAQLKLGDAPHVLQMIGVVSHDSSLDQKSYVQGLLFQYCSKGDLKNLLKKSNPSIEPSRKYRWAAQIAHGLLAIHQAGLIHGDLRCQNIVVDESDNAQLIDITNGLGVTEGWNSILDEAMDPKRDVYSFGVTLWEIIHDGADPRQASKPLSADGFVDADIRCLIKDCVAEDSAMRPSLAKVYELLGGCDECQCSHNGYPH